MDIWPDSNHQAAFNPSSVADLKVPVYFCPETQQYKKLWGEPFKAETYTSSKSSADNITNPSMSSKPIDNNGKKCNEMIPRPLCLSDNKLHQCSECFKQYSSHKNLSRHMLSHAGIKLHKCPHCFKSFSQAASVKRHIARVHLGEKKFACPQCDKQYFERQSMMRHLSAIHNKEKPHECEICKKSFTRKSTLTNHLKCEHKLDSEKNENSCMVQKNSNEIKNMSVLPSTSNNMVKHEQIVECSPDFAAYSKTDYVPSPGNRTCPHCMKSFTQSRHVQRHIAQVHLGEKNYTCHHCNMKFFEKQSMDRHVTAVHDKVKPYVCERCHKAFARKSSLKSHMHSVHHIAGILSKNMNTALSYNVPIPVPKIMNTMPSGQVSSLNLSINDLKSRQCNVCDKHFPSPSKLRRHMMSHSGVKPYTCSLCMRGFTHLGDINRHISRVHLEEKHHSCNTCGRQFFGLNGLKHHISAVHNHERPHVCCHCNKAFTRKHRLRCHIETVHSVE